MRTSERPATKLSKAELEKRAAAINWFHSIDLGQGVVTNGHKTPEILQGELDAMRWPDLTGKSVIDINTWDGFFAFEAERRGAARVVATDEFVWTARHNPELAQRYADVEGAVPGKAGFDLAHEARQSGVEAIVGDLLTMDLAALGTFDVVLYLGSLYHMADPLGALRRVAQVTKEVAIIETEAIAVKGFADHALCEFFPASELNSDPTNWWAPNGKSLEGLCRAAGFSRVELMQDEPPFPKRYVSARRLGKIVTPPQHKLRRYRAVVQAWK